MNFTDKNVLITGGSSGIGKAAALLFGELGANIVITYKNNLEGAMSVVAELNNMGVQAESFQVDLTEEHRVKKCLSEIIDSYKQIDVLVNNAGRYIEGDEWNNDVSIWDRSLKQNLISTMLVSQYVIQEMMEKKSGVIVNIASRFAGSGQFDAISYSAAKAGIVNITQSYAKRMAPWGRANAVSPGPVHTGYWLHADPVEKNKQLDTLLLKQWIEPEDIANTIVFLASDNSRMITGQNIIVDGGYSIK